MKLKFPHSRKWIPAVIIGLSLILFLALLSLTPIVAFVVSSVSQEVGAHQFTYNEVTLNRDQYQSAVAAAIKAQPKQGKTTFTTWSELGLGSLKPLSPFLHRETIAIQRPEANWYVVSFITIDLHHGGLFGIVYSSKPIDSKQAAGFFTESGYATASQIDPRWFTAEDNSN